MVILVSLVWVVIMLQTMAHLLVLNVPMDLSRVRTHLHAFLVLLVLFLKEMYAPPAPMGSTPTKVQQLHVRLALMALRQ